MVQKIDHYAYMLRTPGQGRQFIFETSKGLYRVAFGYSGRKYEYGDFADPMQAGKVLREWLVKRGVSRDLLKPY